MTGSYTLPGISFVTEICRRAMDSHLLVVPGVSISLEGSQDESGVVAWVGATTFSTLLGGGSIALDTSYGAVGRLRRFNSCILPLPLFRLVSATSSTLSQRFSYGFFPTGFPRFSRWV